MLIDAFIAGSINGDGALERILIRMFCSHQLLFLYSINIETSLNLRSKTQIVIITRVYCKPDTRFAKHSSKAWHGNMLTRVRLQVMC